MNYEERKLQICEDCENIATCPYIRRELEYKCQHLSDIMYGWELGNNDAVEKASLFVYHLGAHPNVTIDGLELEKSFKEYMEEQQ